MPKRIQVIVNPASGRDRPILNTLNTVFGEAGMDWDVAITKGAGDATRLAAKAAQVGSHAVAVYGGDGTVTEAAAGLINTQVPLAILPGGTANAIAVALGIPADLAAAAKLACGIDSVERDVDLGKIDQGHFLVATGIGIPGELAEGADRGAKDKLGMFAYLLSSLQALRNARVVNYTLTLDGKKIESEGVTVVIANMGNFGIPGLSIAPMIDMSDGLFDVLVFRAADLTSLLSVAANAVLQDVTSASSLQHWQARRVEVYADPPQAIQADGEVLEPGPITATVLPCAVRLIVPAS